MTTESLRRPELLAPAGTEEAFQAALASGADAVYLGLAEGFNARGRSTAFSLTGLGDLVRRAHLANTKLYLTLNTLLFENELATLERMLRDIAKSGVDALIIQDPAAAFLAQRICPDVRLHASTQMTISSPEGAAFAATLGISRVVLPRELSVEEIARFARQSPMECEVFVHGALCMAWSGQCLTSEAFSGRSANRGQCSQACRMPYEAIIDGQKQELGDLRYLLSPQDLSAHAALPGLLDAGVASLKIEGRYKGPAYVATAVESWRRWRDALLRGATPEDRQQLHQDVTRTRLTFSRGDSLGFLGGDDHQSLVVATTPKHRGIGLGTVERVEHSAVLVRRSTDATAEDLSHVLRAGVGVAFELRGRSPEEHDPEHAPGGPVFQVRTQGPDHLELVFGKPGPDLARVRAGDAVRLTGDPEIARVVQRLIAQPVRGRVPLTIRVAGTEGEPLKVVGETRCAGRSFSVEVESSARLTPSRPGSGLEESLLREKLCAFGESPFSLAVLDLARLSPGLHLPVSELKRLRRDLVAQLELEITKGPAPELPKAPVLPELRGQVHSTPLENPGAPVLIPLCRTEEQLDAVIASTLGPGAEVELDWMEMVGLGKAVRRARDAGLKVTLATVRVQKPGEEAFDRRIAGLLPDGVLVRHWGALMHFSQANSQASAAPERLAVHGDFSLNVTNSLTAHHLLTLGLDSVTASHDLSPSQLLDLLAHAPRGRVALTLHHHIPTFHNSHCVYAHLLSHGSDYRTCGRPCENHRVALRDYAGHEHPVVVDVSCRNTMFNAFAQSAAPLVPQLLELGVRRFRVEFVWEQASDVRRTLDCYQQLLRGEIHPREALERASVHERYGVTTPLRLQKK